MLLIPWFCPFNKPLWHAGSCLNPNHSTDLLYPVPHSTQTAAAVGCAQQQQFPWQVLSKPACYVTTLTKINYFQLPGFFGEVGSHTL